MCYRQCKLLLVIASLMLSANTLKSDAIVSPIQASQRPYDLDIVNLVYLAGSDTQAQDFYDNYIPAFNEIIEDSLNESVALSTEQLSSMALDSSKLELDVESDVRVYFVGERAGYHNSLGVNTQGFGINQGDPELIFPNSSTSPKYLSADYTPNRKENLPLAQGDFVELGTLAAGTNLDFFIVADGARGGTNVFSTNESYNADGMQHVVSFAIEDSSYLLLGFEDIYGGGDMDFNDLLFAVDIGESNVQALIETIALVPEPAEVFLIIAGLLMLLITNNKYSLQKTSLN